MEKFIVIIWFMIVFPMQSVLGAESAVEPVFKVACVGNSITYGTGIADRIHDSYPSRLQNLLGNKYEVRNFGCPGATLLSHGHKPYIQQQEYVGAKAYNADIIVIHLGINDTDPRNWPNFQDEFVRDYLRLIQSFRNVNPKARLLIAKMTPIADRHPRFISGTSQWHEKIQRAIETVAAVADVELIDFHAPLYPYPTLFPDAIHPNEEGASILAKTVYAAITGHYGGLHLSELYTDYMVLQRNRPLLIQGIADAGSRVVVKIAGQRKTSTADNQGKWQVALSPLSAGEDYVLEISTKNERRLFKHVAVGEVWLCSGQSNMEFKLKQTSDAEETIAVSSNASIRFFDKKANWPTSDVDWPVSAIDSVDHLQYFRPAQWSMCTPQTAAEFSAVAYHFGRMLQDSLQVPVGLICNAVGGATTESWIDRHTLEYEFPAILKDWLHNDFIQQWARERAAVNLKNSHSELKRHPFEPCYLFESGILPLNHYPIKGAVWYQGESNAHNLEAHERLFKLLVESWRKYWDNPDMPFYFVQLSGLNRPSWPSFRDSQRRLMETVGRTGMVVSADYGDSLNVHPCNKRPVGERLARWALSQDYGYPVVPSGPLVDEAKASGNTLTLTFRYGEGLHTSDRKPLRGFEVAEVDGLYYPAKAVIVGEQIVLQTSDVKHPRFVRYGWKPFTDANLVNKDELPASTFKVEVHDSRSPEMKLNTQESQP